MALVTCADCREERVDALPACPRCGRPDPVEHVSHVEGFRSGSWRPGALVGLLVALGLTYWMYSRSAGGATSGDDATSLVGAVTSAASSRAFSAPRAGSGWSYSHGSGEMMGKVTRTASLHSEKTVDVGLPDGGAQHGRIVVTRDPLVGRSVRFMIERGQLLCPDSAGCSVMVRFDDGEPLPMDVRLAGGPSATTMFIQNDDWFLSRLRVARRLRISPTVHHRRDVVFTFDVAGFDMRRLAWASDTLAPMTPHVRTIPTPEFSAPIGRADLPGSETDWADLGAMVDADGGPSGLIVGPLLESTAQPYFEFQVERSVQQIPGRGDLQYPDVLRSSNVEGEVLAQFVVDARGRYEFGTFKVLKSSHGLFTSAVTSALPDMRFHPAVVGGRKVRQLVQHVFTFSLRYR